jgi:hypothetical protein
VTLCVGDRVRYWPLKFERTIHEARPQPFAATVTHVWGVDGQGQIHANVVALRDDGHPLIRLSVVIAAPGQGQPGQCEFEAIPTTPHPVQQLRIT